MKMETTAVNHRLANRRSSVPEWVTYLMGVRRQATSLAKMHHCHGRGNRSRPITGRLFAFTTGARNSGSCPVPMLRLVIGEGALSD